MPRRRAILAMPALLAAAPALAFPERAITLVTGYAPGGSTDIAARLISERLAANLGVNARIVVENRPGASGAIASEWLRRQPADGHTLMVAESGSHAIAPNALVGGTRYDPLTDFTYLGVVSAPPLVLIASRGFAGATPSETVVRLREAPPDSLAYATSGVGGVLHLAVEMLAQALGTKFVHVPYRSGGQMLQAIITGDAQFGIAALASAAAQLREGLVRPVAVTGRERFPAFPEIPTLEEAGVPEFELRHWFVLCAPPALPTPVAEALNRALEATLAEPAVRAWLLVAGHLAWTGPGGLAAARAFVVGEFGRHRDVIQRTGMRLEP